MTDDEREMLLETPAVQELLAEEKEACISLIRDYLLHNSQRAASWHEVQDCITAIRNSKPTMPPERLPVCFVCRRPITSRVHYQAGQRTHPVHYGCRIVLAKENA